MRTKFGEAFGEIDSLPGCSQVAVSHGVYIPEDMRGDGCGKHANQVRCMALRVSMGYDYVMCTTDASNKPQVAILEGTGWRRLDEFRSSKTGHDVIIWGKVL